MDMNLTQKSRETIDSCRFCWMCRHICPIGNATGQERNNARARALSLSLVNRSAAQLSEDIVDNVYECALCGACTKECATGWDPVAFTKEVRLRFALEGKTPAYIEKLLDSIEKTGNPYGVTKLDETLTAAIQSLPRQADTLLFLGQDARCKVPEAAINAIHVLQKADVMFTVMLEEPDSGSSLDTLVGAAEETRGAMLSCAQKLSAYQTVIVFDPADAKIFAREYREWNIPLTSQVKTFTAFLAELTNSGALKLKKLNKTVAFQDPAQLARDLGETEEARTVIKACVQMHEMLLNRKDTMWAGSLLMNEYLPGVMEKTAENRWENALATDAEALVTASPSEYAMLQKTKPMGMELLTLEQLVLQAID